MNDIPEKHDENTVIKKREICNIAMDMQYENRLHILELLKQQLNQSKIIENADGCRVNLDTLSSKYIDKLYYIIKNKSVIPTSDLI